MGSAFHQLCPRYSGTLTPTAPTAIRLWDTFTFYTALPHNLINDKLVDLIFQIKSSLYIACNYRHAFITSDVVKIIIYGLVRKCQKYRGLIFGFTFIYIR